MNALGVSLPWCALQATLYLLSGLAIYLIARRFGPALGAWAAASTLAMLCCLTASAFSPWPCWWTLAVHGVRQPIRDAQPLDATREVRGDASAASGAAPANDSTAKTNPSVALAFDDYWQIFRAELAAARATDSPAQRRRWPAFIAALFVAGASLGLARFVIGLAALRSYRGRLGPVAERRVLDLAQSLARQMDYPRPIELKQSSLLTTPATIGWRRPVIVLPADWQTWSDEERRVVLAHEIAHIVRRDYLAWLLAQISVALHFYHPLVYWLAGRLRLEQELAADAWAAEMSGGREVYLLTLARMALRQDDRRVTWAARPFLPNRGALLRRIEMLSEAKPLRNVSLTRRRAAALAAIVAIAGLIVSGVRGPLSGAPRLAQAAPPDKPQASAPPKKAATAIDLRYVPPDAVALLAVRPAQVLGNPDMKPLTELLNGLIGPDQRTGLKLENIEEFKLAIPRWPVRSGNPGQPPQAAFQRSLLYSIRSKDAFDWKGKFADNQIGKSVEASVAGKTYYHSDRGDQAVRMAFYTPDDRTIVVGPEIDLIRTIAADKRDIGWAAEWDESAVGQVAAMIDLTAVNRGIRAESKQHSPPAPIAAFAPIWEQGQRLFISAQSAAGLSVSSKIVCASADDASRVAMTIDAAFTLARNALSEADRTLATAPAEQAAAAIPLIDLASEVLKQGNLRTEGSAVIYASKLDLEVAETTVTIVAPGIIAARRAAQRSQAANNVKQMLLAFQNYAVIHGHFPPPVVIGPDGKTPHSWRVEILPFVDQSLLHQRYKMDEPWDSENNRQILTQMPAIFRAPAAETDSNDASYFALLGPSTALGPKDGKGTRFAEIADGMSNTIAIVEAKRSIPWTKPEDIDYDPNKPLPKLGGWHPGGFFVGTCDVSVHFLPDTLDQQKLRAMITKAGREEITKP